MMAAETMATPAEAFHGARDETSPPEISASGRGRCRSPRGNTGCKGGKLPDKARAYDRRLCRWRPNDILARLIGQGLSERLGQQFVIENRTGAGDNIGTEAVVNSSPDDIRAVTSKLRSRSRQP
jgi:hypothetical protein